MPKNILENTNLRSEEVQEILTKIPHWMIRWGSFLFLCLIFMLLFISWFVKYPDVIVAQAEITTKVPPAKEYAQLSGKIDTIFVEDDQLVKAGQPLAILENTANFEDVFFLESIVDTISLENQDFEFPINEIPILFLGDIDSEYALFENSYIQYSLNNRLQPYDIQVKVNQISLSELQHRLEILLMQQELEESALAFKKAELNRNRILFGNGIISSQEFETIQLGQLQAEQSFKNLNISISQTKEAIAMAQKTSTGTNIERTRDNMMLLKSLLQSFNQLKIAIETWKMQFVLVSDIDGKVAFMNIWSENQNVSQGDLVFTVIPSQFSAYLGKLKVPAQNSGKIIKGQKVNISLKNYPETEFGVLQGKVESISILPNREGNYLIDVSLPEELITSYGRKIKFKQEMAGTANIITEDLRLIERFFYQIKNIFNR